MGEDDRQFFQKLDTAVQDLGQLRNALHISLGITPLCLLLPYQWSKTTFNRRTVIEVSHMLFLYMPFRSTTLLAEYLPWKPKT